MADYSRRWSRVDRVANRLDLPREPDSLEASGSIEYSAKLMRVPLPTVVALLGAAGLALYVVRRTFTKYDISAEGDKAREKGVDQRDQAEKLRNKTKEEDSLDALRKQRDVLKSQIVSKSAGQLDAAADELAKTDQLISWLESSERSLLTLDDEFKRFGEVAHRSETRREVSESREAIARMIGLVTNRDPLVMFGDDGRPMVMMFGRKAVEEFSRDMRACGVRREKGVPLSASIPICLPSNVQSLLSDESVVWGLTALRTLESATE